MLIKGGALINYVDRFGKTALHYGAENGNIHKAWPLLSPIQLFFVIIILIFLFSGHANVVAMLIKNGAEVNIPDRILGQTALHLAAKSGKISMFNQLSSIFKSILTKK